MDTVYKKDEHDSVDCCFLELVDLARLDCLVYEQGQQLGIELLCL